MTFGEIPTSGLGGDVIERKLLTDDGHPMITIAPCVFGSGALLVINKSNKMSILFFISI